jgi:hypothetical protein
LGGGGVNEGKWGSMLVLEERYLLNWKTW